MHYKSIPGLTFIIVSAMLTGCNSSDGSNSSSIADQAYKGTKTDVAITANNAAAFPKAAFAVREFSLNASSLSSFFPKGGGAVARCENSGQALDESNIDDSTHTGSMTITFNQCLINDTLVDGVTEIVVFAYDTAYRKPVSLSTTFHNLSMSKGDKTVLLTGTLEAQRNIPAKTARLTINTRMLAASGEEVLTSINSDINQNADATLSSTLEGKVCVGSEGCVNMQTAVPFIVNYVGNMLAGELISTGATSRTQMLALSDNRVQFGLDANGDGTYEQTIQ